MKVFDKFFNVGENLVDIKGQTYPMITTAEYQTSDLDLIRANVVRAQLALDDALDAIDAIKATDEAPPRQDPRAANARGHHRTADNKIDGIYLAVHYFEDAPYRLTHARLIDENEAQGQHVAKCRLLDSSGRPKRGRIVLAWPYNGNVEAFEGRAGVNYDGGVKPAELVITAKFVPPNLGPLVLYVAGADDSQMASDVLASLGLPLGHHVGFEATFQEV